MPDLIDLMENDPEPEKKVAVRPGFVLMPKYPTLGFKPHDNDKVQLALRQKDWRALNHLSVRWWDQYAQQWFKFSPHFFQHLEYMEVSDAAQSMC